MFCKLKEVLLYGTSFTLRQYEKAVLDAWRECLPAEGNALLAAQLKHLVSYQRQAGGKLLGFFTINKQPYPSVPAEVLFPCILGSCTIARVHLVGSDQKGTRNTLKAEIHLHKGRLISIEFNHPPAKKLPHEVEGMKVEILRDPMIPASEETISEAQRREEVLKTLHSILPDEYFLLVEETKGGLINEWDIRAVQDVWKHLGRDGNYYLLADKEGMGAVGVKEDDFSGQLYYLDQDDNQGEKITVGLRTFFEKFDGGKVVGRF